MTTYIQFAPSPSAPFQFQPTLDGQVYTGIVRWNVFRQGYYLHLYSLAGALIFCLPLIGSPPSSDISLAAGYFASTLVYRPSTGNLEISP